jgi:hypothetical protein
MTNEKWQMRNGKLWRMKYEIVTRPPSLSPRPPVTPSPRLFPFDSHAAKLYAEFSLRRVPKSS